MPPPGNKPTFALGRCMALVAMVAFSTPSLGLQKVVPDDYETIAEALNAVAGTTDATVIVEPGTYQEAINIPSGVVLRGRETARTFLTGTGSGPVITAYATRDSRISNFTFEETGGHAAIAVDAGSNLVITNNVFSGIDGAAVTVGAAIPSVRHNVFFQNSTALNTGGNRIVIENNAFVSNGTTLTLIPTDESAISHNGFYNNDPAMAFGLPRVIDAPQFVATGNLDFHLRSGSPYINAGTGADDVIDGTQADIGAYGGAYAEGIPFPVGTPSFSATTDSSITLSWPANNWYKLGGYKIYYDSDKSGTPYSGADATEGVSPIDVGNVTQFTLSGLTLPVPPAAPVLNPAEPINGALKLSWSAVPSASGYIINYGIASTDEHAIDLGNVTSHTLSGLQNDTTYRITVSAYAKARYFLVVTDYANFGAHPESTLSSEVSTTIGNPVVGATSNEISDFPEPVVPFPNLPDKNGCFIATAAYGYYSTHEVQLLRAFRDRYLLTNAPGRAFVAWYYRHSPRWAQAIQANGWAKPVVRVVLLPAIGLSAFLLKTSAAIQFTVALALFFSLLLLRKSRMPGPKP